MYSITRRLTQVVYTLQAHIDSTLEIRTRRQLCNCSHTNETVGSYQPFHDQIGHGLTIRMFSYRSPRHTSPLIATLALPELLSLFDQQADLLTPTTLFKGTFVKGEVNIQHTFIVCKTWTCIDGFKSMKDQVSSPSLINLKKYNDDHMVQNAVYVLELTGIGIVVGIVLPLGFYTGVGIEFELLLPELELNYINGIGPGSALVGTDTSV